MNNPLLTTIVHWETRNWRHAKRAVIFCKNYGLKPVAKHLYAGELYEREKAMLLTSLQDLFNKKTDHIVTATLCQSCSHGLDSQIWHQQDSPPHFAIVMLPESALPLETKTKKC